MRSGRRSRSCRGSREWGMGSGEWGTGSSFRLPIPHSPFPIPYSPLPTPDSLELRNLLEVLDEHLDAARGLAPVVILVLRVIAVLGQAQAEKGDRRLEVFLHRDDRAD